MAGKKYVRVTIKAGRKTKSFWAIKEKRGKLLTLYIPVDREGEDKSYYRKDGALVIRKDLIANSLIVKEKPARMNKFYGTMEVIKEVKRGKG